MIRPYNIMNAIDKISTRLPNDKKMHSNHGGKFNNWGMDKKIHSNAVTNAEAGPRITRINTNVFCPQIHTDYHRLKEVFSSLLLFFSPQALNNLSAGHSFH
jgi:hypothetical protein